MTCSTCKKTKAAEDFYKDKKSSTGYTYQCKQCRNEHKRAYRAATGNADGIIKMGLTVEQFEEMKMDQNNVCAICKRPETVRQHGKVQRLSIDHDHDCCDSNRSCGKCVRGLLCSRCNSLLGTVNDDIRVLGAAIDYLRNHE